jgi:hypothetical protein
MPAVNVRRLTTPSSWLAVALVLALPVVVLAQPGQGGRGGGRGGGGGAAPRAAAPVDLTGYWVSIVTEDWIERMSPDSPASGAVGGRGGGGGGGRRGGGPPSSSPRLRSST